jgi:hypothetical protein
MSHFDYATISESVYKPGREQKFQSPVRYRLYWSTFYRAVNQKTSSHRRKSQVWLRVHQVFSRIWSWWVGFMQSSLHAGENLSQVQSFISEEG